MSSLETSQRLALGVHCFSVLAVGFRRKGFGCFDKTGASFAQLQEEADIQPIILDDPNTGDPEDFWLHPCAARLDKEGLWGGGFDNFGFGAKGLGSRALQRPLLAILGNLALLRSQQVSTAMFERLPLALSATSICFRNVLMPRIVRARPGEPELSVLI